MATNNDRQTRESPDYWWICLSMAMREGDLSSAAEAQRELRNLGVEVRFRRVEAAKREDVAHAS